MKIFISVAMALGYFVWLFFARRKAKAQADEALPLSMQKNEYLHNEGLQELAQAVGKLFADDDRIRKIMKDSRTYHLSFPSNGIFLEIFELEFYKDEEGQTQMRRINEEMEEIYVYHRHGRREMYDPKMRKAIYQLVRAEIQKQSPMVKMSDHQREDPYMYLVLHVNRYEYNETKQAW